MSKQVDAGISNQLPATLTVCLLLLLSSSIALAQKPKKTPSAKPQGVELLKAQARALKELATSPLAVQFLDAVDSLPRIKTRTLYRNRGKREWYSPAGAKALKESDRKALEKFSANENFYYQAHSGSPLTYVRVIDLAARAGFTGFENKRVMDFGCGSVGQLRLMASLGADVVGVDPSPMLKALYHAKMDQGEVLPAKSVASAHPLANKGRVTLVNPRWPPDKKARELVGGQFDLIISKNTLKYGYIHPERKVDPAKLVHLGVSDAEFVSAVYQALKPGGFVVIYNLAPAPAPDDQPYLPWADGRCPFARAILEQAGFEIIAIDGVDHAFARSMFKKIGYPTQKPDGSDNLFALFTIVRRPP